MIGKFESPEALLAAYESLEKEFTRRSQKLRILQDNGVAITKEEYAYLLDCEHRVRQDTWFTPIEDIIEKRVLEKYNDKLAEAKNRITKKVEDDTARCIILGVKAANDKYSSKQLAMHALISWIEDTFIHREKEYGKE